MMEDEIIRFRDYLTYERRYSPHTVKAYLSDLGEFAAHLEASCGGAAIAAADTKQIRGWVAALRQHGISPVTANRKISTLRSFYKWLLKTGQIQNSPAFAVRNLKKPRHLPEFVTEDQMDSLLDSADAFGSGIAGERDRLVVELFYDTGIRETELINLRCCDVDEIMQSITVHGKGGKTRIVPISSELCGRLSALKSGGKENFIFLTAKGNKMYPKLVYRIVHRYLEGAQGVARTGPHTLRHSFATAMLNNGAPLGAIKELLGHASLSATQIYTHASYEQLRGAYNKAHPRA